MARPAPVLRLALAAGLLLPLCAAPPSPQDHVRVLPVAGLQAHAVDVLMDHGYVVRSADAALGTVSFAKVFQNGRPSSKHLVEVEGSLVIRPLGDGTAKVRMLIQQRWADMTPGMLVALGVEADTDESYYLELFKAFQIQ